MAIAMVFAVAIFKRLFTFFEPCVIIKYENDY